MFQSLFNQTKMMAFGLNLAEPATKELSTSFWQGLPYLLLVISVGALNYYQQRQVQSRVKDVNPQQQMIMKVLPIGFAVFALILPAGLIIYFITSSVYRIVQQSYITRRFYRAEDTSGGDDSGNGAKKGKPAPKPAPATTQKGKAPASRPTPKPRPSGSSGRRPQPSKGGGDGATPAARPSPNRPTPRPRTPSRPTPKKK
jgi:membrane protein insertase Oxa1/YidC/SpoIIIJ